MDADLLGLKKSDLASSKRAAKGSGKEELPSHPKSAGLLTASEKGEWERAPGVWTFWGLGADTRKGAVTAVGFLCGGWRGHLSVCGGGGDSFLLPPVVPLPLSATWQLLEKPPELIWGTWW